LESAFILLVSQQGLLNLHHEFPHGIVRAESDLGSMGIGGEEDGETSGGLAERGDGFGWREPELDVVRERTVGQERTPRRPIDALESREGVLEVDIALMALEPGLVSGQGAILLDGRVDLFAPELMVSHSRIGRKPVQPLEDLVPDRMGDQASVGLGFVEMTVMHGNAEKGEGDSHGDTETRRKDGEGFGTLKTR